MFQSPSGGLCHVYPPQGCRGDISLFIHIQPILAIWKCLSSISNVVTSFDIKVFRKLCCVLLIFFLKIAGDVHWCVTCARHGSSCMACDKWKNFRMKFPLGLLIRRPVHIASPTKIDLFLWVGTPRQRWLNKPDTWNLEMHTCRFFIISFQALFA